MARVTEREYTYLSDKDIAATAFGTTPAGVAFMRDIQQAAFNDAPVVAQAASAAAAAADTKADTAQQSAAAANTAATAASTAATVASATAASAQNRADAAYTLAGGKVTKDAGPTWAAPTGTSSRSSFASYTAPTISDPPTQAEVQALANALQAHSRALKAVVDDLRANHSLTS